MDVVWLIFFLMIGACVGSFLNVVLYRLPRGESIVFPGSRCPACGRAILWHDNIPLISWVVLRGRCRACKAAISPRYLVIEAVTAALWGGLFACYFLLGIRQDLGDFLTAWPTYVAHAVLLSGLLVCLVVDLELWIIPLEVTWVCAIVGVAAAAYRPSPAVAQAPAGTVAAAIAALVGLACSALLMRKGFIQPSFLDAADSPVFASPAATRKGQAKGPMAAQAKGSIKAVAITADSGVNPRTEILREVLYLLPAIVLAAASGAVLRYVPAAAEAWNSLFDTSMHPILAAHFRSAGGAVVGLVVGGGLIWTARILGTLAFGKEAMGLGDAHLLAAVGAVTGWLVPSLAFFLAPFLGLLWALYLWLARSQRELPYGPWLAAATLLVLLFYDAFWELLAPYAEALQNLFSGVQR